jgi:nucleoside-diphosphate-sugar epimerase
VSRVGHDLVFWIKVHRSRHSGQQDRAAVKAPGARLWQGCLDGVRGRLAEVAVFVVGGHGYVGSRVVTYGVESGASPQIVSRDGDTRNGRASLPWSEFIRRAANPEDAYSIVWLLDGAKHNELTFLREVAKVLSAEAHVVLVSTCTVYGDAAGQLCNEESPQQLTTPNAKLKAECEQLLLESLGSSCIQRLGALYGVDDRGVRADRVQKWVTQAAEQQVVTVPEPTHWRGWVHRDQAARSLYRAARDRVSGTFNVASANYTFGTAAGFAAHIFDATVQGEGKPDLCNYQVDSTAARAASLLDERPGEDLPTTARTYAATRSPR